MSEERRYLRFSILERLQHWIAMLSFTVLALTGLVQKFAQAQISVSIIELLGGIEVTRIIHRTAAIILMVEVVYHLGSVGYKFLVKRSSLPMLPSMEDLTSAWHTFRYYLGLARHRPQQGRYTFEEKAEYWAFVWGTAIMALTGFMLWNPIATARFFPGEFIPAAKAAHGNEALLAVLAIILWHFYHVHLRTFNKSMFSGYLNEEEMIEEHPKELADIKAGLNKPKLDKEVVKRRRRIFIPVYGLVAVALLFGIYEFATFEQTAIETVPTPADEIVVYAPFTPTPEPTSAPTEVPTEGAVPTTWQDGINELFIQRCGSCHGDENGFGGFNASSYDTVIAGGNSGSGIVPNDPDASVIVQVQVTGQHPGQFTGGELDIIRTWIASGAPEQ